MIPRNTLYNHWHSVTEFVTLFWHNHKGEKLEIWHNSSPWYGDKPKFTVPRATIVPNFKFLTFTVASECELRIPWPSAQVYKVIFSKLAGCLGFPCYLKTTSLFDVNFAPGFMGMKPGNLWPVLKAFRWSVGKASVNSTTMSKLTTLKRCYWGRWTFPDLKIDSCDETWTLTVTG